jgi:hypothetical protein
MREALFPNLRDIQDAKTGKVLTAGQQFHNIITTSPQFVKSYNVPNLGVRKNIVLPLSIFLDIRGTTQNPEFMVDATNCLHTLVQSPSGGGTLAVSALVSNGNSNVLNVDVWRGGMDYMRSCKETDEYGKYKINVFTMGYGQGSSLGKMDNPPSFITRSDTIQACDFDFGEHGPTSNSERCMKTFARDRSLAASDWKVVVPLIDIKGSGANGWIMGDGMVNKPVIEDIILYFRTRSIPISAAKY